MGGALQAHYLLIVNPSELGFFVSLTYIIFLVVGGIQTLWGPILAAVVLTLMPESIRFAGEYRMILYGFIVVVTVLVRPTGMISRNQLVRNDFSINGKKDKTSRLSADV
jgi:branched-chain amino acid transport system permease protein